MSLKRNILSKLYQFGHSVTKVGLISKREGIDLLTSIVASKNEIAKKDRNLQIFYDEMEYTKELLEIKCFHFREEYVIIFSQYIQLYG